MYLEPEVLVQFDLIKLCLNKKPLQTLASDGELSAYKHDFVSGNVWILARQNSPNKLWDDGKAPWKVW